MKDSYTLKNFIKKYGLLIIVLIVTVGIYTRSLPYEFLGWDDDKQITENSLVKDFSFQSLSAFAKEDRFTFLTLTSYSLDYLLWGLNPIPFRAINILLHLINICLVFAFSKIIFKNARIALISAALFAIHPLRIESVVWISERKDLLFTFFSLISFLFYIRFVKNPSLKWFLLVLAMVILASLSKIQALLIPASLLLIDYLYKRPLTLSLFLEKAVFFVVPFFLFNKLMWIAFFIVFALWLLFRKKSSYKRFVNYKLTIKAFALLFCIPLVAFLFWLFYLNGIRLWSDHSEYTFSFVQRIFMGSYALSLYLIHFFVPVSLSAVYPYPVVHNNSLPLEYYLSALAYIIPLGLFLFAFTKRALKHRIWLFGLLFFVVNISIVLHWFPIEGRLVAADRYTYLAYFGLFATTAWFLDWLMGILRKNMVVVLTILMVVFFSVLTVERLPVWQNTRTLFSDVLAKYPEASFAQLNLGATYLQERKFKQAMFYFNESIRQDSLQVMAYYNRGLAFYNLQKMESALHDFNRVIERSINKFDKAVAYNDRGQVFLAMGNADSALASFNRAVFLEPRLASAYNNRGWLYLNNSKPKEAEQDFKKALELNPEFPDAQNNYGWVLIRKNDLKSAIRYFNRAIELNPVYSLAYNNRGYAWSLLSENRKAMADYTRAIEIDSNFLFAYQNRAWVAMEIKQYDIAIQDYSFILRQDTNNVAALTNRAFAFAYSSKSDLAVRDFSRLVQLNPSSGAFVNLGWIYSQDGEFDKAVAEFTKALDLDPNHVQALINRGWAYYKTKKHLLALADLQKAIQIKPDDSNANLYFGIILNETGKKTEACKRLSAASEMGNQYAKYWLDSLCRQ